MQLLKNLPGLLFGLVFAGSGIFFLYRTAWPTWQSWTAMRSWQPAQAQLLHVAGADNETLARYRYLVQAAGHLRDFLPRRLNLPAAPNEPV